MLKSSKLRALPLAVLAGASLGAVVLTTELASAEPPAARATAPSVRPTNGAPASESAPAGSASTEVSPPAVTTPAPSREALDEARRHFDVALECYSRGRYRDAIAELEAARRLDPSGKDLVYNLALVHEKLGELPQALTYLRRYLEMETDAEERARTEASILRLEGALREHDPESLELAPSAPSAATAPLPPAPPGRLDAWVWGTAGVAISALVVGAVLGVRALALNPGPSDGTGGSRSVDDVRSDAHAAHSSAIGADIAFGVAGVTGAAATLLYFGRAPLASPDATSTAVPLETASPKLGLDLNFAF